MSPISNSHRRWVIPVVALILLCGVSSADGQTARPSAARPWRRWSGRQGHPSRPPCLRSPVW